MCACVLFCILRQESQVAQSRLHHFQDGCYALEVHEGEPAIMASMRGSHLGARSLKIGARR